jgi:hypothetical protein
MSSTFMAVAVETFKHPLKNSDYKVWYLELNTNKDVIGIGVKTREGLIKSVFKNYHAHGESGWRAFCREAEESKSIDVVDFIAQNSQENTHFGNLPTLAQFQTTLNYLQMNLELQSIAS